MRPARPPQALQWREHGLIQSFNLVFMPLAMLAVCSLLGPLALLERSLLGGVDRLVVRGRADLLLEELARLQRVKLAGRANHRVLRDGVERKQRAPRRVAPAAGAASRGRVVARSLRIAL